MDFMKLMNERFAAKSFSDEKISKEDINSIVEFGRLSPSSFGLEPWKFIVVSNQELKDKLVPACYNQRHIGTASHVMIILNKRKEFEKGNSYISDVFRARMPENVEKIHTPMAEGLRDSMSEDLKDAWTKRQGYLAAANMMTGAKSIGIDSCPMEGFVEDMVLDILGIDKVDYGVAMIVVFGFADKPGYPKTRFPVEEVAEFRD